MPIQYLNASRCSGDVPSGGRTNTTSLSLSCVLGPTQITSTSSGMFMFPAFSKCLCAAFRSLSTAERTSGSVIVSWRNATAASLLSFLDFHVLSIFFLLSLIVSRHCKYGRRLPSESRHMRGQLGKNSLKFRDRGDAIKARIESSRSVIDPSCINRSPEVF